MAACSFLPIGCFLLPKAIAILVSTFAKVFGVHHKYVEMAHDLVSEDPRAAGGWRSQDVGGRSR